MRRFRRALAGFFLGLVGGAVLGALGGTLDHGSTMILMPSGPPFWALVGATAGSFVGALYGAIFMPRPNLPSSSPKETDGMD